MASAQDIRDLVSHYVCGEIPASDLANRFTPVLIAAIKSHDSSAKELALAVHAQVSHYFNGLIPEDEFRANLAPLAVSVKQGVACLSIHVVQKAPEPVVSYNTKSALVTNPLELVTS